MRNLTEMDSIELAFSCVTREIMNVTMNMGGEWSFGANCNINEV